MQRFKILLIIILFTVWIMPIGAFLTPKQSEEACNGRRAICLCPHLLAKQKALNATQGLWRNAQAPIKSSIPGTNPYFIHMLNRDEFSLARSNFLTQEIFLYHPIFINPIEHVPKV